VYGDPQGAAKKNVPRQKLQLFLTKCFVLSQDKLANHFGISFYFVFLVIGFAFLNTVFTCVKSTISRQPAVQDVQLKTHLDENWNLSEKRPNC